jgi:hypothetical protein
MLQFVLLFLRSCLRRVLTRAMFANVHHSSLIQFAHGRSRSRGGQAVQDRRSTARALEAIVNLAEALDLHVNL